ncbi:MAG: metal-sulfur cluster assembly factor [Patescibacteria group bacterium]
MVTEAQIIEVLKSQLDPELGIDIYTLGFIYKLDFDQKKQAVALTMTFTTPLCPFGPAMVKEITKKLSALGLKKVSIRVVFDPPWKPSAEVRQMLGL